MGARRKELGFVVHRHPEMRGEERNTERQIESGQKTWFKKSRFWLRGKNKTQKEIWKEVENT